MTTAADVAQAIGAEEVRRAVRQRRMRAIERELERLQRVRIAITNSPSVVLTRDQQESLRECDRTILKLEAEHKELANL